MTDQMSNRQLGISLFAGLCAPLAVVCSAYPWPGVLLGLGVAGLGNVLMVRAAKHGATFPAFLRIAYLLWTLLIMAKTAELSRACFQDSTGFIPLVLLALSAAAAQRGAATCGRLGAILWIALAALLGGLLVCAAQDFAWPRFVAQRGAEDGWPVIAAVALSPAALLVLLPKRESSGLNWGYWMAAIAGLAASVVSCGVLGSLRPHLAQPLYNMVQGVSVLGVAERLEALLSAALSIGYFLALSFLCAAAGAQVRPLLPAEADRWISTGVAAAALALYRPVQALTAEGWVWLAVLFGLALPFVMALAPTEKIANFRKKVLTRGERRDNISELSR